MMRLIEAELERRSLAGNSQLSEEVETSRETVEIGRSREPPTLQDQMLSPTLLCQKSPDSPGIRFSPEEQLAESPSFHSYLCSPATGNDTDHLPAPPNLLNQNSSLEESGREVGTIAVSKEKIEEQLLDYSKLIPDEAL
jgi:hypothetical protein